MKSAIRFLAILILFSSCQERKTNKIKEGKKIAKYRTLSFLDSLKTVCRPNTIDTFDIEKLKTDNFKKMIPINKKLFHTIYPNRNDFSETSFFIYTYLPNDNDYLTLIIYQKKYEGENYRVDTIDLVNIDSTARQLDKILLATKDNEVITHEVVSYLTNDTLKVVEHISTESYFNPDLDTLYIKQIMFKLNGLKRIDTLEIKKDFIVRKY